MSAKTVLVERQLKANVSPTCKALEIGVTVVEGVSIGLVNQAESTPCSVTPDELAKMIPRQASWEVVCRERSQCMRKRISKSAPA